MSPESLDRRAFLGLSGATFICTLAGHEVLKGKHVDIAELSRDVEVPPNLGDKDAAVAGASAAEVAQISAAGPVREYWIAAEERRWNIVPTHRDQMMNKPVKMGKTTFDAWGYRPYSADFAAPLAPASIPGPLLEAEVGETLVVHFRNKLKTPVTMHPHGVFYSNEMDGAYKGKFTDPGGFVQPNRTFTYVWEAREGTEGTWLYHDHGPMDPLPGFKGLFGPLIIRKRGEAKPDQEYHLAFHTFDPTTTGLKGNYNCINGKAYAGNTPTLESKVGQRVAFHVFGFDNFFHTFHVHGHRWTDPDGTIIDNKTFGPADSFKVEFVEDNPGRWFYHCHVFQHFHMGMNGWYVVS